MRYSPYRIAAKKDRPGAKDSKEITVCPVGLSFSDQNVTCRSCVKQGVVCKQSKQKVSVHDVPVKTSHSGQVLTTTRYLNGLNFWHGRPPFVYLQERRAWELILAGTWALWGKQKKEEGKRLLLVRRFVVAPRCLIKDHDNLVGGIKPVKDMLVRQGVFIDDADKYLEFDIQQEVDSVDPRVEIEIRRWCA